MCVMLFLELTRRQEDLRRIDELRSYDFERRRNMMPMHLPDAYNIPVGNAFRQNPAASAAHQYHNFHQVPYPNSSSLLPPPPPPPSSSSSFIQQTSPIDAAYTTNQVVRGHNLPTNANTRPGGVDYNQQQQGFERKRPRY